MVVYILKQFEQNVSHINSKNFEDCSDFHGLVFGGNRLRVSHQQIKIGATRPKPA